MTRRILAVAGAMALAWGVLGTSGCVQLTLDSDSPVSPMVVTAGPRLERSMPDAMGYDGSIGSMACVPLTFPDQGSAEVREVALMVGINHPFVGDLVIKVVSPQGTVVTVLNRAGFDEPADSDVPEGGDSSGIAASDRITFRDGAPVAAEQMGGTLESLDVVCRDDHRCDYAPSPGSGPGTSLADFQGEPPGGDWQVCIADGSSGDGDTGVIQMIELSVVAW
jgi:hypothetical protein